jgi:hypothetical protein
MKPFWDKHAPAAAAKTAAAPVATTRPAATAPASDFFSRAKTPAAPKSAADFFNRAGAVSAEAPTAAQARVIAQKKCPVHGTQMVVHGPSAFRCTTTGCKMIIN